MLIEHLNLELSARRKKNSKYSLRSFSCSLGMSSSALSALLNRKRPLTAKTAHRILKRLDLSQKMKSKMLLDAVGEKYSDGRSIEFAKADPSEAQLIARWEHFAILSLMRTRKFKADSAWIASYFNISTGVAIDALNRLERLGLIDRGQKPWKVLKTNVTSTHDVPSIALRQAHRSTIKKALHSLEHHAVDQRDITGMTLTVPQKKLREAKERITEFRRSFTQFLEEEEGDDVYRLNIQFFPMKN